MASHSGSGSSGLGTEGLRALWPAQQGIHSKKPGGVSLLMQTSMLLLLLLLLVALAAPVLLPTCSYLAASAAAPICLPWCMRAGMACAAWPCNFPAVQKSCRLRWYNQLCPGVKRTPFSEWEQAVIIKVGLDQLMLCCAVLCRAML